ncbi:helix-turn-helix transcriptional regulator [Acidiferrimicrobium sp. IK]|uniref:winged helix-turn-helix transcriptional regulator n=1 Tax=Acidiferrimicrobium sp. IK TaxID=2871700 RepID=UPI0021CAECFC|nr:helix-turn-helix domain-containing protein [Acidiferrimicrobium sp. IK]MCU4186837.1 helix-turn-helix transcriptional regulator [Acidiferrimicrobium sp. IK]
MPADDAPSSPLASALGRVGDRWSLLIVDALLDGPLRYGELQQAVSGIATNMLAQRLRHLEAQRVVVAEPYSRRPARYSYDLTATGRSLAGALRLLAEWGAQGGGGATARHRLCGTPMEVRWYCPTCDLLAGEEPEEPIFV